MFWLARKLKAWIADWFVWRSIRRRQAKSNLRGMDDD